MNIDDFRGEKPALDLFDYFEGHSTAWGWFEDRFGTIKRQFRVEITGTITAGELRLDEEFFYRDGARARRVWHINRTGEAGYCGRADDVVGVARGRAEGPALNWRYRLALPVGKRSYHLDFDDWIFLQDGGVMTNRALVKKWGFVVGRVALFFQKSS